MLPDPLHPAVVHLPIALAVLIPLLALLALVAIQRAWLPARSWWAILLLQAMLLGSGWLALETGEDQEERVEKVVAERHIEEHEEAAERFMLLAGVAFVVLGTGLLADRRGSLGRLAGTLATVVVLAGATQVGHYGGELVYKHGAAAAYVDKAGSAVPMRSIDDDDDD
jgi:uncharacterized membrane protein